MYLELRVTNGATLPAGLDINAAGTSFSVDLGERLSTSGTGNFITSATIGSTGVLNLSNPNIEALGNVSSTAPEDNEVLKWNGNEWAPAADTGSGSDISASRPSWNNYFYGYYKYHCR